MFTDTSCQQVNIPVTLSFYMCYLCVFPLSLEHSTSAGGDTHSCLVWRGPDFHCSSYALWRCKTKARRFGGHCVVKSGPSNQWDITATVPQKQRWCLSCEPRKGNSWGAEGFHLRGYSWRCLGGLAGDMCSAALTFAWWGSVHPLVRWTWEKSDTHKLDRITLYYVWLTLCSLECRCLFNITRTNSLVYLCPLSVLGIVQNQARKAGWSE